MTGSLGGIAGRTAKAAWKPQALEECQARFFIRGDLLDLGESDIVGRAFDRSMRHGPANLAHTSDQEIKTQDIRDDVSAG